MRLQETSLINDTLYYITAMQLNIKKPRSSKKTQKGIKTTTAHNRNIQYTKHNLNGNYALALGDFFSFRIN